MGRATRVLVLSALIGATAVPAVAESAPSGGSDFGVVLRYRAEAGLASFVHAVSDPQSPKYRHFLSTAQFQQTYAPTALEIAGVTSWLGGLGIRVEGQSASGVLLRVHGDSQHLESALTSIPSPLLAVVAGVVGTDRVRAHPAAAGIPATFYSPGPPNCSMYWHQYKVGPQVPKYRGQTLYQSGCGYRANQIRAAYGMDRVRKRGDGTTVAIIGAYEIPRAAADLNDFSKRSGLPQLKPGQYTENAGAAIFGQVPAVPLGLVNSPESWNFEEAIDLDAVHLMAPGANLEFVSSPNELLYSLLLANLTTVEAGRAQVINNSWGTDGEPPTSGEQMLLDQITAQAAAKGVTIVFCTGDDGDEVAKLGSRQPDFPSTSDLVTSVGGTSLRIGAHSEYLGEDYFSDVLYGQKGSSWNLDHPFGLPFSGGGGESKQYKQPDYQKKVVPASVARFGGRVTPDLSLDGDCETSMLYGMTSMDADGTTRYTESNGCGTSVSAPLFVGMVAVAVEVGKRSLGALNPTLYRAAGTRVYRDVSTNAPSAAAVTGYDDFTNPHSRLVNFLQVVHNLGTLHLLKGFDDATGLGSPYGPTLISLLAGR